MPLRNLLLLLVLFSVACSEEQPQQESIGSPTIKVLMDRLVASYEDGNPAQNDHYRVTPLDYDYTPGEVAEMLIADSGRFAELREVEEGEFYASEIWDIDVEALVAVCCTDCQCAVYYPVGKHNGEWYTARIKLSALQE